MVCVMDEKAVKERKNEISRMMSVLAVVLAVVDGRSTLSSVVVKVAVDEFY